MTSENHKKASPALVQAASAQEVTGEMAKYGITRVPVDYFHYGKYRYTKLEDAFAEATREQTSV